MSSPKGVLLALGVRDASLDQPVYLIRVAHSREWAARGLGKLWVIFSDASCSDGILAREVDDPANNVLEMSQEIVKSDEIQLRFNMGVFGKLVSPDQSLGCRTVSQRLIFYGLT